MIIAIAAGTAALFAGLKVRGVWATLAASLLMGGAVRGMHWRAEAIARHSAVAARRHMQLLTLFGDLA